MDWEKWLEEDDTPKDPFLEKLRQEKEYLEEDAFAQELYAALCNNDWVSVENPKEEAGGTWRYNGGLVADARGKGEDYMDFYCSGNEGRVSDRVHHFLNRLGYALKAKET